MDGGEHLETPPVFRVAIPNLAVVWPQVVPLLIPLIEMRPTHLLEDVRRMLLGQQSQLWVQMSGPVLDAFAITEFAAFPQGVWVHVWLAAARSEVSFDYKEFREALSSWGRVNGCRGVSATGRIGWLRHYPEAEAEGVVMRATWQ